MSKKFVITIEVTETDEEDEDFRFISGWYNYEIKCTNSIEIVSGHISEVNKLWGIASILSMIAKDIAPEMME